MVREGFMVLAAVAALVGCNAFATMEYFDRAAGDGKGAPEER
jgi:hypothetical protein